MYTTTVCEMAAKEKEAVVSFPNRTTYTADMYITTSKAMSQIAVLVE